MTMHYQILDLKCSNLKQSIKKLKIHKKFKYQILMGGGYNCTNLVVLIGKILAEYGLKLEFASDGTH